MYKYIPRDQNLVFSFWIFLWMFGQVYCCYELTWHSICVSGRGQKCGVESLSCRKVLRIELNFPRICVSIYKCWSVWPVLKRIDNATQTWWMPFSLSLLFLFFYLWQHQRLNLGTQAWNSSTPSMSYTLYQSEVLK